MLIELSTNTVVFRNAHRLLEALCKSGRYSSAKIEGLSRKLELVYSRMAVLGDDSEDWYEVPLRGVYLDTLYRRLSEHLEQSI